jgi:hypothetical protein
MTSQRWVNLAIRTEKVVLVVALAATAASVMALLRVGLREDYRLEAFVATHDESYERFRAFMEEFTSNEFALFAIHSDGPFDAPMEQALTQAVDRLREVPSVARAGAVTDIPAFVRMAVGDRLFAHPLLAGNLISQDRRTVAVLCRMEGERGDGAERRKAVAAMRAIVDEQRAAHPAYTYTLTGPYVTLIDMYAYVDHDLMVFSILAFALVVVTLGAVFRRAPPMLYAGAAGACAILCTLGLTILLGIVASLITQMLVILIIVLAVANCVHLAVAAEETVEALPEADRQARYRATLSRMLAPCTAVIATTAAGFGSVCVSEIAPVRRFGALMVFGLVVALVVSLAGAGALHRQALRLPAGHHRLGKLLTGLARLALRRRSACVLIFVLLIVVSIASYGWLRFESDFVKNFRAESEVRRSYRFIEENLSPLGSVEIVARRKDGASVATADAVRVAHELGRWAVEKHALVRRSLSLHDLLTLTFPRAATTDAEVQVRLAAVGLWPAGAELREGFLNESGDALRINLRCVEGFGVGEKLRVCAAIEAEAAQRFGPEFNVEVTGLYHFYAKLVAGLLRDQYNALGLTIVALAAVTWLMLRSLRWMLIAMAINLLPVVVCLGAMGWLRIPVNMTTAMMLAATLGIAVDDTLHYIWRFRREYAACGDTHAALWRAHASVGRACVFTTVVIAGGFSILLLSEFLPTAYFGGLVGFTMFVALAADLLLLPVLIDAFHPERDRTNQSSSAV